MGQAPLKQNVLPPVRQPMVSHGMIPGRPIVERAKVSQKTLAPNMVAYGANTHNGLVRNYNEDRISIVLDLKKPGIQPNSSKQPKFQIQFFAIFDGHGGQGCAEFLRDNLHNLIASQPEFPNDLEGALR